MGRSRATYRRVAWLAAVAIVACAALLSPANLEKATSPDGRFTARLTASYRLSPLSLWFFPGRLSVWVTDNTTGERYEALRLRCSDGDGPDWRYILWDEGSERLCVLCDWLSFLQDIPDRAWWCFDVSRAPLRLTDTTETAWDDHVEWVSRSLRMQARAGAPQQRRDAERADLHWAEVMAGGGVTVDDVRDQKDGDIEEAQGRP